MFSKSVEPGRRPTPRQKATICHGQGKHGDACHQELVPHCTEANPRSTSTAHKREPLTAILLPRAKCQAPPPTTRALPTAERAPPHANNEHRRSVNGRSRLAEVDGLATVAPAPAGVDEATPLDGPDARAALCLESGGARQPALASARKRSSGSVAWRDGFRRYGRSPPSPRAGSCPERSDRPRFRRSPRRP